MYLELALQYKVKQGKNGKFPSHYKLAQLILKRKSPSVHKPLQIEAPPKISPSKRAFEKSKPRGLFSEFYGMFVIQLILSIFNQTGSGQKKRWQEGLGDDYFREAIILNSIKEERLFEGGD